MIGFFKKQGETVHDIRESGGILIILLFYFIKRVLLWLKLFGLTHFALLGHNLTCSLKGYTVACIAFGTRDYDYKKK